MFRVGFQGLYEFSPHVFAPLVRLVSFPIRVPRENPPPPCYRETTAEPVSFVRSNNLIYDFFFPPSSYHTPLRRTHRNRADALRFRFDLTCSRHVGFSTVAQRPAVSARFPGDDIRAGIRRGVRVSRRGTRTRFSSPRTVQTARRRRAAG